MRVCLNLVPETEIHHLLQDPNCCCWFFFVSVSGGEGGRLRTQHEQESHDAQEHEAQPQLAGSMFFWFGLVWSKLILLENE